MDKNQLAIPAAIIIAGALIAGSLYLSNTRTSANQPLVYDPNAPTAETQQVKGIQENDWIKGDKDAKIAIVEYSDPECPFCRIFNDTMIKIIDEFGPTGDVVWVYRHLPLAVLHQKAQYESEAMECAGKLGGQAAFWSFATELYTNTPSNDGLDHALLPQFAKNAGVDVTAWQQCLDNGDAKARIDADLADAESLGISGTPQSFILYKGQQVPIEGAQPYDKVRKIIQQLLTQ
jgi:protein-disulfide isomerase